MDMTEGQKLSLPGYKDLAKNIKQQSDGLDRVATAVNEAVEEIKNNGGFIQDQTGVIKTQHEVWKGKDKWRTRFLFALLSLSVVSFTLNIIKINHNSPVVSGIIELIDIVRAWL